MCFYWNLWILKLCYAVFEWIVCLWKFSLYDKEFLGGGEAVSFIWYLFSWKVELSRRIDQVVLKLSTSLNTISASPRSGPSPVKGSFWKSWFLPTSSFISRTTPTFGRCVISFPWALTYTRPSYRWEARADRSHTFMLPPPRPFQFLPRLHCLWWGPHSGPLFCLALPVCFS